MLWPISKRDCIFLHDMGGWREFLRKRAQKISLVGNSAVESPEFVWLTSLYSIVKNGAVLRDGNPIAKTEVSLLLESARDLLLAAVEMWVC